MMIDLALVCMGRQLSEKAPEEMTDLAVSGEETTKADYRRIDCL